MYRLAIDCPSAIMRNNIRSFARSVSLCSCWYACARFPSRFSTILENWMTERKRRRKKDPHKIVIDHFHVLMSYSVLRDSQPRNKKKRGKTEKVIHFYFSWFVRVTTAATAETWNPFSHLFFFLRINDSVFFLFSHTLVIVRKCFKYLLNIFLLLLCLLPRSFFASIFDPFLVAGSVYLFTFVAIKYS